MAAFASSATPEPPPALPKGADSAPDESRASEVVSRLSFWDQEIGPPLTESSAVGGAENTIELASQLCEGRRRNAISRNEARRCGLAAVPAVDYGRYPVAREASQGCFFRFGKFLFETAVHALFPLSVPIVFLVQGRVGLEQHGWFPAGRGHKSLDTMAKTNHFLGMPVGGPGILFILQIIFILLSHGPLLLSIGFAVSGFIPGDSPVLPDIFIAAILELGSAAVRGFKYAFRSPASEDRLIDHVSRRHEEISSWLTMPEDWAVFLIRLAASRAGLDLGSTCVLYSPKERMKKRAGRGGVVSVDSLQPTPGALGEQLPFLTCAAEIAPELLTLVRERPDGSMEMPAAVVMLQIVIPLCGVRYTSETGNKAKGKRQLLGEAGHIVRLVQQPFAVLCALMPTLLRAALLREPSRAWALSWAESLAVAQCCWSLWFAAGSFINMILHSCAMYFRRRLLFLEAIAGLLTGTCPGFGDWRLSFDYSQAAVWNSMRRALLKLGENYARRSLAVLAMFFSGIVMVKAYVLFLFLATTMTGEKVSIKDEPVLLGMLGLVPFMFAPGIILALSHGAKLNYYGKRVLLAALNHRSMALVDAQALLSREAGRAMSNAQYKPFSSGEPLLPQDQNLLLRTFDLQTFEHHMKQLELVEQAFGFISSEVDAQLRTVVLIGWDGDGLFELSRGLVLQFVSESIVNLAFLFQIASFK